MPAKGNTSGKRGGKRPGAGRKPGTAQVATTEKKKGLAELAQAHTAAALKALADICKDPKAPAASRVQAASALLDRGYGKPVQSVEHAGPGGRPMEMNLTKTEQARRVAFLLTDASRANGAETQH